MTKASELFNPEQIRRINEAIAEAESKTSAEIVPVLATASGRYDRAEDMVGLWLGAILLAVVWFVYPSAPAESGGWGGPPEWLKLIAMVGALLGGFLVGALLADKMRGVRRLFTPKQQMIDEVNAAARAAFFDNRIHHTDGGTGLLLYVSLHEHLAVVLGDAAVIDELGETSINELCEMLTTRLHAGNPTEAFCETVLEAGTRLGQVLPRAADDKNELVDELVLMD